MIFLAQKKFVYCSKIYNRLCCMLVVRKQQIIILLYGIMICFDNFFCDFVISTIRFDFSIIRHEKCSLFCAEKILFHFFVCGKKRITYFAIVNFKGTPQSRYVFGFWCYWLLKVESGFVRTSRKNVLIYGPSMIHGKRVIFPQKIFQFFHRFSSFISRKF